MEPFRLPVMKRHTTLHPQRALPGSSREPGRTQAESPVELKRRAGRAQAENPVRLKQIPVGLKQKAR